MDEVITKKDSTITQKAIELLIPTATSFVAVNAMHNKNKWDYTKLTQDLMVKLLCKIIMVRLFQTPGTTTHKVANTGAILGTFYKFDKNNAGILKYISPKNAFEKIPLDFLRSYIQSKQIDLGDTLNPKHRKKAIAKTTQVILHPALSYIFDTLAKTITS